MLTRFWFNAFPIIFLLISAHAFAQSPDLSLLNRDRPMLDAHNCYPYEGRWADRVTRALGTGSPVGIEQDLAWYVDPASGKGRVVVTHKPETDGSEPELKTYFFERVRPIVEKALRDGNSAEWPLIVVHFDFKDNQLPLLRAVWSLLGQYEDWITTGEKLADPKAISSWKVKPLLVLTEDPDAQEQVFSKEIPVGARLRIFGSAHTHAPKGQTKDATEHLLATTPADQLLTEPATNYRRWWNNSWHEVEEGGQPHAGDWTQSDDKRLRELVDHAHQFGYWMRFYTLDGFDASVGKENGWFESYNFGSRAAVEQRWKAAIAAGVDLIATDQYEDLAPLIHGKK
ncbi:MAG: hypothetical protein ACJ746_15750 [Bryobacteraceae bacterium]